MRTIAKPEKIAPATKYGAKIVVCQPGTSATAKSQETTLCTERTSGVARPDRCSTERLWAFHWLEVPTQAITFGNLKDDESAASKQADAGEARAYHALHVLNTRPAITYLAKVRRGTVGTEA